MYGDRLVEDLTVFIITDSNYSDSSLVSLHSFRKYHTLPVKVYCLDFTENEFEKYRDNANKIGNVTPINWKMPKLNSSCYSWNKYYYNVFNQISAKFAILNDIHTKWVLYFDTDTLFINSIAGIFDNPDDLNGVCLNKSQVDINCGLFMLKNKEIDWLKEYINYCQNHSTDYFGIDEGFLSTLYKGHIKQLPDFYSINGYYDITKDTKMIHYMGAIKPFQMTSSYNLMCSKFNKHFKLWYDYYDTVKDLFVFSDKFNNDVNTIRHTKFNIGKINNDNLDMRIFISAGEKGLQLIMNRMITEHARGKS